ncbi:hypothetical protein BGZ51_004148 [Haplosporangium sp. Z 767]|nr:hypothetical protein BGZ51_004148 [Haplosporangium sp. Z 767]
MAPVMDHSEFSTKLHFYLNGTEIILENPDPDTTLLQYVRSVGLTGTKLGCAEGGCGACTVMVSSYDKKTQHIKHLNVNGCLTPLCSVDGKHVITIEGLGDHKNPHPVQERIALCFGSQCGFCTPGIAMSLYTLLRNNMSPSEHDIEDSFDGNLCRCTGYRPILDAAKSFAVPSTRAKNGAPTSGCCGGMSADGGCCKEMERAPTVPQESSVRFPSVLFKEYDPTQELIFPPRLMKKTALPLHFQGRKTQWFRPTTLAQVLKIKAAYPQAKFVGGNTEIGIETKFKHMQYSPLVYLHDVEELQGISVTSEGITIGANVTIASFQQALQESLHVVSKQEAPVLHALLANMKYFAGHQIRNSASVAGNIATASPISDLNPVFVAANATFNILSSDLPADAPARVIPATEFFVGYRKTAMNPATDILTQVHIPLTRHDEYIRAFKQAKRRDDDIAIVTAAIRARLSEDYKVIEASFGYGGMAAFICQAKQTSEYLLGKTWGDKDVLDEALAMLDKDLPMEISTPGGMPEYRRTLAKSFFVRFWWDVIEQQKLAVEHDHGDIRLMTEEIDRCVSVGTQDDKGTVQNSVTNVVSKSIANVSAMKQATGEAKYTDDIPKLHNELYAALVFSSRVHAKIVSIDASAALAHPGVKGYFDHRHVPGKNAWRGVLFEDELAFAEDTVHCVGQIIGVVVADTQAIAQEASRMVKIEYNDLPAIVTIDEAIAANSFYPCSKGITKGDVDAAFATCAKVFEGETRVNGQEHFYLETQTAIVNYKGEDEFEIYISAQSPSDLQRVIAEALGTTSNKIVVKIKRLGGGFGGKETRSIPLPLAMSVASYHLKRPIRCMLDRNEDMLMSGQRNPCMGKWKVGLDEHNKLVALDVTLYLNGGWTSDMTPAVLERVLTQIDGVYNFHNVRVMGHCCRTNIASNTAFRGFGAPQGNLITECFMSEIAEQIQMSQEEFREINFYKEGDLTHYNQQLVDYHLPKGYMQLKTKAEFDKRKARVMEYNKQSKWRKRGISMIPTKFGLGYSILHLNQAGALLHIYHDGSILLSHGGVEMGQGLHTKMIQVCAEMLEIPMEIIHTVDVATDKVANTISTSASVSSDMNGMAVKHACEQINQRLAPYRAKGLSWKEIVHHAYFDRVNLSANGFYKTPDIGYDWETNSGQHFFYFTMGAAISEVEVDLLTGTHTVLRSDVCMDLGRSINPSVDIGQIEGAFMQGMGLTTTEEPLFFPDGRPFTLGPGNYKIPGFKCIPQEFNISFFEDVTHDSVKTIFKSKGVGEPPLFLGSSVYYAIRNALWYARQENGHPGTFSLPIPATPEKIRMAVGDPIAESSRLVAKPGERTWVGGRRPQHLAHISVVPKLARNSGSFRKHGPITDALHQNTMDSPPGTPTKRKRLGRQAGENPPSSPSKSPKKRKPATPPGTTGTSSSSSRRTRRDQDMSYLERPILTRTRHPVQPPLNSKFERPMTRALSSSELGSDGIEPQDTGVNVESPPATATEGEPIVTEPSENVGIAGVAGELDTSSIATVELPHAETIDEPISMIKADPEESIAQDDNSASAMTAEATETEINTTAQSSTARPTAESFDKALETMTPMANPFAPTKATPGTPLPCDTVPVPAQIAFIAESPSKRVVFSPNKSESRLSTPTIPSPSGNKLKSILKRATYRSEDMDDYPNEYHGQQLQGSATTGQGFDGDEPSVSAAVAALASDDTQIRTKAYTALQAKFKTVDEGLVQQAIKCTGIYLFNFQIVALFTGKEIESILNQVLKLVNTTNEKSICHCGLWTLASARLPAKSLIPFIPQLIQVYSENLDSQFKSLSIMNESLSGIYAIFCQFPSEILPYVQTWLTPVILRLVHNIPGIRSKANDIISIAIPRLIEKDDPRRKEAVASFMQMHCKNFLGMLRQNFLEARDEVYAINVWGSVVTIIGKALHKSPLLTQLLKIAEYCFNSSSQRRIEIKMAAFQAWTRLIYNFAIGGHVASEKPLKLMLTPINNCFMNERHKRVRLACTNTWIALIYALGPNLPKNAELVLFQMKMAIVDESDHIRDRVFRFMECLFTNNGGQDIVEGRDHIVPGTITFADLGLAEGDWIRTKMLNYGLDCLLAVMQAQYKIGNANREEWRVSALTRWPLMIQPCSRMWETIVRAIRDINQHEKGMHPTPVAERAVSSLLFFIEKVSRCNPKVLLPRDWPETGQRDITLLKRNPERGDYILRADIVHYLYACMIEIFSIRKLVTARYRVQDVIHATVFDTLYLPQETASQTREQEICQAEGTRDITLSPIEFILKCWLATGESVIGSAFETSFWQAVATLVDMSKSGLHVLRALYKCLNHMEDIRNKRLTTSSTVWPPESNSPVSPLVFREFQFKYWSIIAQRLGTSINEINEISEDVTPGDQHGYGELINLLVYPFGVLHSPTERLQDMVDKTSNQPAQEHQDADWMAQVEFTDMFKSICMPTWTDLLRNFYKVAQHKRGNANVAMNSLAIRIQECYDTRLPFLWIQSLSIACTAVIVDTIVVVDPTYSTLMQMPQVPGSIFSHASSRQSDILNFDGLSNLCLFLFQQSYENISMFKYHSDPANLPSVQEAAFQLMEKMINKTPQSMVIQLRVYQARVESLWNQCVLPRLSSSSSRNNVNDTNNINSNNNGGGFKSETAFGSVFAPLVSTIRGAYQQAHAANSRGASPSSPTTHLHTVAGQDQGRGLFNSESLALLAPLLAVGLGSERKSIVNKTLEFWNQSFGRFKGDLEYPEEIAAIMQKLKLVATVQLPGWSLEDSSQTEVPQFATMSQEMFSLPAELNVRPSVLKTGKRTKASDTGSCSSSPTKTRRILGHFIENLKGHASSPTRDTSSIAIATSSGGIDDGNGSSTSYDSPPTPSPLVTPSGSRSATPIVDSDSSMQSNGNAKKKRKKKKTNAAVKEMAIKKVQLPAEVVWRSKLPLEPHDPTEDDPSLLSKTSIDDVGHDNVDSVANTNDTSASALLTTDINGMDRLSQAAYSPTANAPEPSGENTSGGNIFDGTPAVDNMTDALKKESQNDTALEAAAHPIPSETLADPAATSKSQKNDQDMSATKSGSFNRTMSPAAYYTAGSEETKSAPESTNASNLPNVCGSIQAESGSLTVVADRVSTKTDMAASDSTLETDRSGSIETGDDFRKAVGHLVAARGLVSTMNMRQLLDLQNQLMTLNQTICGEWNRFVEDVTENPKQKERSPY